MDKENKCDKYEAFFVFQDEESFLNHLKECPDCRREHEKYQKISSLVKEAAPYYKARIKKEKITNIKRIACCFMIFFGFSAITGYKIYDNYTLSHYDPGIEYSCIDELGLPVDDYGFLEI